MQWINLLTHSNLLTGVYCLESIRNWEKATRGNQCFQERAECHEPSFLPPGFVLGQPKPGISGISWFWGSRTEDKALGSEVVTSQAQFYFQFLQEEKNPQESRHLTNITSSHFPTWSPFSSAPACMCNLRAFVFEVGWGSRVHFL